MEKIKLRVSGNVAEITECPEIITSGTVGLPVEFAFDESWEDLNRLAVFRAGDVTLAVEEPAVVPWEVLEKPNVWLQIGVYGVNADGTVVIPTLWVNVCVIHTGADPSEGAAESTRTFWQEMLDGINGAKADLDGHIANTENPHGVTAAQVGATPAGYGFGEQTAKSQDWNGQWRSGIYREAANTPDGSLWHGITCVESGDRQTQIAFSRDITNGTIEARRYKYGSAFGEWEYVNPPFVEGVEYRTTERYNGKAIYKKLGVDEHNTACILYRLDGESAWQPYVPLLGGATSVRMDLVEADLSNRPTFEDLNLRQQDYELVTIVDQSNPWEYTDILVDAFPTCDFYWRKFMDGRVEIWYMAQYPAEYSTSTDQLLTIKLPFTVYDYVINVVDFSDYEGTVFCYSGADTYQGWGTDCFEIGVSYDLGDAEPSGGNLVDFDIFITGRWK